MNTNLKSKFQVIAWCMTVVMIFSIIILILGLTAKSYSSYRTLDTLNKISTWLTPIMSVICGVSAIMMNNDLQRRGLNNNAAICFGIGFIFNAIIILVTKNSSEMIGDSIFLSQALCLVYPVLMLIGACQLSGHIRGMATVKAGFILSIFCNVAFFIVYLIADSTHSYSSLKTLETIGYITMILIVVAIIVVFTGWWLCVGGAGELDEDEIEYEIASSTSSTPEAPQQPTYQTSSVGQQPSGATAQEIAGYRASLRLLDDAQLNAIMMNPASYSPAFVAEATSMIMKRRAWEKVSILPDAELMQIVSQGTSAYSSEECDAASMVLYSRKSPLFVAQFQGLGTPDLQKIVNNPDGFFEGYVAMARDILAQG